jgi:hypothetical protein
MLGCLAAKEGVQVAGVCTLGSDAMIVHCTASSANGAHSIAVPLLGWPFTLDQQFELWVSGFAHAFKPLDLHIHHAGR